MLKRCSSFSRALGPFTVSSLGLGCMNLNHAYGTPPTAEVSAQLLLHALERGVTLFDTAPLYGGGENEKLLGNTLAPRRSNFTLATKAGLYILNGKRVIDGRPQTIREQMDLSLQRLQTDCVDLLYLHRWDKKVPIEDSVGSGDESWCARAKRARWGYRRFPRRASCGRTLCSGSRPCKQNTRCGHVMRRLGFWRRAARSTPRLLPSARSRGAGSRIPCS